MTGTQWQAVIIRDGKIFVGLIFMVEGTHENFNTMKISAYTVHACYMYMCIHVLHVHVQKLTEWDI